MPKYLYPPKSPTRSLWIGPKAGGRRLTMRGGEMYDFTPDEARQLGPIVELVISSAVVHEAPVVERVTRPNTAGVDWTDTLAESTQVEIVEMVETLTDIADLEAIRSTEAVGKNRGGIRTAVAKRIKHLAEAAAEVPDDNTEE